MTSYERERLRRVRRGIDIYRKPSLSDFALKLDVVSPAMSNAIGGEILANIARHWHSIKGS